MQSFLICIKCVRFRHYSVYIFGNDIHKYIIRSILKSHNFFLLNLSLKLTWCLNSKGNKRVKVKVIVLTASTPLVLKWIRKEYVHVDAGRCSLKPSITLNFQIMTSTVHQLPTFIFQSNRLWIALTNFIDSHR